MRSRVASAEVTAIMMPLSTVRFRTGVPCALALVTCLAGPMARADEGLDRTTGADGQSNAASHDEASKRFARGLELYREGAYPAALIEFRRAYALVPSYKLLYNIGQVCYQLQNYACALQSLEQYLGEGGPDVPATRKTSVDADIAKLRTRVGKVMVRANVPGATVSVDDAPVGKTPLESVMVSAGTHRISVAAEGRQPLTRSVSVAGEETATVEFEFTESGRGKADANPQPVSTPKSSAPIPSWPFWAGTVALAAGAGITGYLALQNSNDLENQRNTFGSTSDGLHNTQQKATSMALASDILTGAAVVCGGVALYLTVTSKKRSEPVGQSGYDVQRTLGLNLVPGGVRLRATF